jgi:hypothetical protein
MSDSEEVSDSDYEEDEDYDDDDDDRSASDEDSDDDDSEDDAGDGGISKEERAEAERLKKQEEENKVKAEEARAAELEAKKKELEQHKLSALEKTKAVGVLIESLHDFTEEREEHNEKAIATFASQYKDCCVGKQGARLEAFLSKKNKGVRTHNPQKYVTRYMNECKDFQRCVLDGEFDSIKDLSEWHHVALLDSLMSVGGSGDKPLISIRTPPRKLSPGEMDKIVELVKERPLLNNICLNNSSGWETLVMMDGEPVDKEDGSDLKYMDLLINALSNAKNEKTSNLNGLELAFVMPNDFEANGIWLDIANFIEKHRTLKTLKISFKRRKTVISVSWHINIACKNKYNISRRC